MKENMKKIFGEDAIAIFVALSACSLIIGLAYVYAMDKFI
jgi:hypothetical protein